jgi:polyisoprenyl-phosphate glycosyltransferase
VSARVEISVVTPAFNEADNLDALHRRLAGALNGLSWEWILVDDHSSDDTFGTVSALAARDPRVTGLRLARNVGSHAAILCGLAQAGGAAAVVLAADGEDPPEEIARLIAEWRAGAAVVWAERSSRHGRGLREEVASHLFHRVMRRWSGLDLPASGSDFFLVARPVIDVVNALAERNANVMALIGWIGFDQAVIRYEKEPRASGQSGWTTSRKVGLLLDSILGFSLRPIRAMSVLGLLLALFGFLYAAFVIANAFVGRPIEGWSSLMVVVLVLGGIQMVMLGVLGEYLWRSLDETRARPRYIIEKRTANGAHHKS